MLPIAKRRKGCQQFADQKKDDQTLNESSLNKLVGAADMYNLDVSRMTVVFCHIYPWVMKSTISSMKIPLCRCCTY